MISQADARRYRHERDLLRVEVERLQARLALYAATVTTGGPPPGYHRPGAWRNETHAPPASAADPKAPPLRSRRGSDR